MEHFHLVEKPIKCVHIFRAFSLILVNKLFCLCIEEYFSSKQTLDVVPSERVQACVINRCSV